MAYAFDPEYQPLLTYLPALDVTDVAAARALIASMGIEDPMSLVPAGVSVSHRSAASPDGPDVEVVVFEPADRAPGPIPAIAYFHGGGFVFGDANTDVRTPAALAAELGVIVASVNYRLAPECPFPAPLDDCLAAVTWLADDNGLDVDRDRIAVAGISAGAGLAASVALKARDIGGPAIVFQALDSPVLDDRLSTASMTEYVDTPLWSLTNAVESWKHYLGADADRDATSPYAAPARAADLSDLPPAYISVSAYDPLRDEGIDYARRLLHAGVPTELHLYPGTFHGSAGVFPGTEISRRVNGDYTAALRRALAR